MKNWNPKLRSLFIILIILSGVIIFGCSDFDNMVSNTGEQTSTQCPESIYNQTLVINQIYVNGNDTLVQTIFNECINTDTLENEEFRVLNTGDSLIYVNKSSYHTIGFTATQTFSFDVQDWNRLISYWSVIETPYSQNEFNIMIYNFGKEINQPIVIDYYNLSLSCGSDYVVNNYVSDGL